MKKSVINQFEKTLRKEMNCWDNITFKREDTEAWTTIYVMDKDATTLYSAVIKTAIQVVDSYNTIYEGNNVCFLIETRTFEGGWVKPIIKILISRK